jgi:hypothetical protein
MRTIRLGVYLPLVAALLCLCVLNARGQTTGFTYQGRLTDGGTPANGDFGFVFRLFATAVGDTQIGQDVNIPVVTVENGIFTVTLDFGANAFPGADRFLEIIVYHTDASGIPVILSPRQRLTSTPYAIRALSATTADTATNANQLGGTAANQFVLTGDARLSDARTPIAGSNSYIQNGTLPQAGSSFNISGDGTIGGNLIVGGSFTLNTVNAITQYNLGGVRVLSNGGTNNFFAGQGAGQSITTGDSNSFFGPAAGQNTADGRQNAFFGRNAGQLNTGGSFNAFFGSGAGLANVSGNNNAFFGFTAGRSNDTGFNNSFFGNASGFANTGGGNNSFFGFFAGNLNTTGTANNFFGANAGSATTTGFSNTFIGNGAGNANTTGNSNTLLGNGANVASGNLFNASAVGATAFVSQPNSLILGSINGVNGATADTNVGIGTTAPTARLHVVGDGLFTGNLTVNGTLNTTGSTLSSNIVNATTQFNIGSDRVLTGSATFGNLFVGQGAGGSTSSSNFNSFFGISAGSSNGSGDSNSFFGYSTGGSNTLGRFNTFFGAFAGESNTIGNENAFFGGNAGLSNTKGENNSFFGQAAGYANTEGGNNSFFGFGAGNANTTGSFNSFFGQEAGFKNTADGNSFFGRFAGYSNTVGINNSFFGLNAGYANVGGIQNSFFGQNAGGSNQSGGNNSFFGQNAGAANKTGGNNSFFGQNAGSFTGFSNTAGNQNSFFGVNAGAANDSGFSNTAVGFNADFGANNLHNATAIGNGAIVSQSDALVLGNSIVKVGIGTSTPSASLHVAGDTLITGNLTVNGTINATVTGNFIQNTTTQQASSNFNISGDGTAGGTLSGSVINSTGQYNIRGGRVLSASQAVVMGNTFANTSVGFATGPTDGSGNTFVGAFAGNSHSGESSNTFIGTFAGSQTGQNDLTQNANRNTFVGSSAGSANATGNNNSFFGAGADFPSLSFSNASGISLFGSNTKASLSVLRNATAIGYNAQVDHNDSLVLGSINGVNGATADTNVGIGTTAPQDKLHVNGNVRVTNGGIYVTNPNTLIITSPNGACWGITVNNSGALSTFPVTCPP